MSVVGNPLIAIYWSISQSSLECFYSETVARKPGCAQRRSCGFTMCRESRRLIRVAPIPVSALASPGRIMVWPADCQQYQVVVSQNSTLEADTGKLFADRTEESERERELGLQELKVQARAHHIVKVGFYGGGGDIARQMRLRR
ncbi:unnamed protein product [Pleuronectes platessa]|uniref:Uncharacterized protein n=1 Tax=Pleuronectes platessa TaxID=8262 RepID=A0A9N7U7E9_PLEPL|nr:unnamed protein product [Pleuronectes platessa]